MKQIIDERVTNKLPVALKLLYMCSAIVGLSVLAYKYSLNLFYVFLFFIISMILIVGAKLFPRPLKIIARLVGIFILLELIIIPFLTVCIISYDAKSFTTTEQTLKNELSLQAYNIDKKFNPVQLIESSEVARAMLKTKSHTIDTSMQVLANDNLVFVDSFIIHLGSRLSGMAEHRDIHDYLVICNKLGEKKCEIDYPEFSVKDGSSLKQILSNALIFEQRQMKSFVKENERIVKRQVWDYSNIWFYTITFQDLQPISRLANIIYWFHQVIIYGFLFSIVVSLVVNYISRNP